MILDPLEEGDTLRLNLNSTESDNRLVAEGTIVQNDEEVLILKDEGFGPLLSCRVLKSEIEENEVPVKVLMKRDGDKEVLRYEMGRFKSHIDIDSDS